MEAPPSTELIAGKYQLITLMGRGGMGSVWEGKHITLGTRVAIKFIEADHASSDEARQRFDNEARAAATIRSKFAIQIFDHGLLTDGRPYIVMEYLTGEPLDKRLQRLGTLSLPDTARILQHVSRALGKAHENGIIHRDLKPENIYLVSDDEDGGEVAKVLDFGIAKITSDTMSISNNTKTGAILGTPYFMSPEQARGLKSIDSRSDIWSLGVIAFRCLTGRLPFDGESVGDLLVKICVAPLPVPSQINPAIPQMFDAWFAKCLEREPEKRFATAPECSTALAHCAGITSRGSAHSGNMYPVVVAPSTSVPGVQIGAHYTPAPYSGTPMPAARATAAGLSTSTTSLQAKSSSGRAALFAILGVFTFVGLVAGVIVIAKFGKKPEPLVLSVPTEQPKLPPAPIETNEAPKPLADLVPIPAATGTLAIRPNPNPNGGAGAGGPAGKGVAGPGGGVIPGPTGIKKPLTGGGADAGVSAFRPAGPGGVPAPGKGGVQGPGF
jgi:eukaryotic-like serine/threonine-protein kinase